MSPQLHTKPQKPVPDTCGAGDPQKPAAENRAGAQAHSALTLVPPEKVLRLRGEGRRRERRRRKEEKGGRREGEREDVGELFQQEVAFLDLNRRSQQGVEIWLT